MQVSGDIVAAPAWQAGSWYETLNGRPDRAEWERLMGHPVAIQPEPKKGSFTMDNSCLEMKDSSLIMRIQYKVTEHIIARQCGTKDPSDPQFRMMLTSAVDCPMRSAVINSAGQMSDALGRGLLQMANGHFLRGLKCICFPAKNRD